MQLCEAKQESARQLFEILRRPEAEEKAFEDSHSISAQLLLLPSLRRRRDLWGSNSSARLLDVGAVIRGRPSALRERT